METFAPITTELDWLLRILVAAFCGALIGYERAIQRKTAGVRTHIVVAIASALFMIVSKYGFTDLLNMHDLSLDPSRIAAQIVTGISFIGAGTILVRKEQISANNSRWCLGNCRHRNGRWCRHVLHRHLINRPAFHHSTILS